MVLLDFRMHRAGVNCLASRCDPGRVPLQCHAAFRTIARLIRFRTRTHRTKIFRVRRRLCRHCDVMYVGMIGMRSAECGVRSFRSEEFLPAMVAAEIERLSIALGAQRGRFIHHHAANWVGRHKLLIFTIHGSPSNIWTFGNIGSQTANFGWKGNRRLCLAVLKKRLQEPKCCFAAIDEPDWPRRCSQNRVKTGNFMKKNRFFVGLYLSWLRVLFPLVRTGLRKRPRRAELWNKHRPGWTSRKPSRRRIQIPWRWRHNLSNPTPV